MPATPIVKSVPVDLIRPGSQQARKMFHAEALQELAESIRENGVVQPLVLRSRVWGYEILAGERRWRAAQLAGLHELPAVLRDDLSEDEAHVLGLIENLQRESLTPIEAAAGLKRLIDLHGLTHEQAAARIGKPRVYVTHVLRLLTLEPAVQTLVDEGHLTLGHAKVLSGLKPGEQQRWAMQVVKKQLTVRTLERQLAQARSPLPRFSPQKPGDWRRLEQQLADLLAAPVSVSASKAGKGELKISFHSLDALDGLLAKLGYRADL
jgi:ParB family transcriptional regulator, chromosome partitioning protein